MLEYVTNILAPTPSKTFADLTFGFGGHSKKLLEYGCTVQAFDRDPNTKAEAAKLSNLNSNFSFVLSKFSTIYDHLSVCDGILIDLGVSSMQLDQPERGFSFSKNGPLSMTMGLNSLSARDIVNSWKENDIADLLYFYGDERASRLIAKNIVKERNNKQITTTTELANIVSKSKKHNKKIHPATQSFQAIRMYVNDELNEIVNAMNIATRKLKQGGRLAIITFHSIEDKLVKVFFKNSGFILKKPQPIFASHQEVEKNIRSRSAKLRWGIKI
ncbi:MAG: 16S rRNA (cytosine(1402)-N(4))-methyltransferase RsmH [Alphaproteobacteria bacterium]|nr:MAG: 16S rRNA (cytosine(1402)-N(4))-methyltransferase RsmH [Alphaproteobacteria bacterium]